MKEEVDELEEQVAKRRKVNVEERPKQGLSSSFMVNKRGAAKKAPMPAPQPRLPLESFVKSEGSIFEPLQATEDSAADTFESNTLRSRCQRAYDQYFRKTEAGADSMVVRVCFKLRKHGVWWVFGEIGHYNIARPDPALAEALRGTAKKVRVMLPPETFTAVPPRTLFSSSTRSSTSTASSASIFTPNSLVVIESPTFVSLSIGSKDLDTTYITVLGRHIHRCDDQ